jgi:hypothetical protein
MATISNEKKGLSFFAVKNTCKPMANKRISSGMVC